ncbi:MAG: biotin transporter BioY [Alphaproteobacteria bacterium]
MTEAPSTPSTPSTGAEVTNATEVIGEVRESQNFTLDSYIALRHGQAKLRYFIRLFAIALPVSLLIAVSAKIQVPFYPVPMTMQPLAVLFFAACMGPRLASLTLLLYLAEGIVGFPVFARGGGLAYFIGPTGGYLVGFLVAAAVVGALSARGKTVQILPAILTMTLGMVIIYALGLAWLSQATGSLEKAFAVGAAPFLLGDAVKIVLASVLSQRFILAGQRRRYRQHRLSGVDKSKSEE